MYIFVYLSFVFLTDNETYLKESDVGCASKQNHGQKIVSEIEKFKLGNFYTYVLDLNYDESLDLLNYTVSGMGVSIKAKSFITDETLFKSRIYKSFKNVFIKFCIINGKRGIGLQQPDENRYTKKYLKENNAYMDFQANGTKREMHDWQHEKILEYKANNNGQRPPLNKSDW